MRTTILTITLLATGCIGFDARGIGTGAGAGSTTGAPCWDCDPYPDARERLTDASHGGGSDPEPEPDPGTSTSSGSPTAGFEPESTTTSSGSTTSTSTTGTSTGEEAGSSTTTTAGIIPQGEPCMAFGECAPSKEAPYAKPECFNGSCELFCKTTADCPPAQVCTFIEGWNYWTCEEP